MRVTIVRSDNTVIVEGRPAQVDCSDLSAVIRVVQWDGAVGWVEFEPFSGAFVPNMKIVDFAPYKYLVDRWRLAFMEQKAQAKHLETRQAEEMAASLEHAEQQRFAASEASAATQQRRAAERGEKARIVEALEALSVKQAELDERLKDANERIAKAERGNG